MTLKEKLETIKGKKIAILCRKEYEARIIHNYLGNNGDDCIDTCYWDNYGMYICYDCQNRMMYANIDWYKDNGYEIISYKDFVNNYMGDCKIHINDDDIIKILDDKYGKDNWVIE